jgi:hypothetical protein
VGEEPPADVTVAQRRSSRTSEPRILNPGRARSGISINTPGDTPNGARFGALRLRCQAGGRTRQPPATSRSSPSRRVIRLSPRSLQKLFDNDGTTFSEYVLGQRLAHAHRALSDPRRMGEKIATIVFLPCVSPPL